MTTLLIDADMLCYRACAAVERDIRFQGDWHILASSFADAKGTLVSMLHDLLEMAETEDLCLFFSDPSGNFRYQLVDNYKEHRQGTRKPLCYPDLVSWCRSLYDNILMDNLEADDALGIAMTNGSFQEPLLWSLDKDLKQIPGWHLMDGERVFVSPEDGEFFHMYQTLVGDVADGYSGCPGVGDAKATRMLREFVKMVPYRHEITRGPRKGTIETRYADEPADSYWEIITSAYVANGSTEEDALVTARLAKILDANHYVNGEIKLWEPSSK